MAHADVLEGLKLGADVSNIFDAFPTNSDSADRAEYSPAWDLNVGVYSDAPRAPQAAGPSASGEDSDRATEFRQYRSPPGAGPSGKTCPR